MFCSILFPGFTTVKSLFLLIFFNNFLMCFNFTSRSSNVLGGPMQDTDVQMHGGMDRMPKDVECRRRGCPHLSFPELNLAKSAVEPKTGIEFPVLLDNLSAKEHNSNFNPEVNISLKNLFSGSFGSLYHEFLCSMHLF